jgi:hypothetical protein
MTDTDEIARLRALWCEEKSKAMTFHAEVERLRAEVAALKANDSLAEMWRELEAYQPQADKDGHGESWRRMCEERTEDAARNAVRNAAAAARSLARAAAWAAAREATEAAICAQRAIAAIRKAKEAKR